MTCISTVAIRAMSACGSASAWMCGQTQPIGHLAGAKLIRLRLHDACIERVELKLPAFIICRAAIVPPLAVMEMLRPAVDKHYIAGEQEPRKGSWWLCIASAQV